MLEEKKSCNHTSTTRNPQQYAIIVAGGSGSRMGSGIPKQFRSLGRRPVVWWSMKAFKTENPDTHLILVLPKDFISLWNDFFITLPESDRFPHQVAIGGSSRSQSVRNGLDLISDDVSLVAVHDGARPLVTSEMISSGWATAREHSAAVPAIPVTDSLRKVSPRGSECVDRSEFVAVQTPQVFKTSILKEAYLKAGDLEFSDDAAVMEHAGHKISLFKGDPGNIKITNPKDLVIAEALFGKII